MTRTLAQRRKDMLKHEKEEPKFRKKPHLKETIVKIEDGKRERRLVEVKNPRSKAKRTQNGRDKNKHQDKEFTQAKAELTLLVRRLKKQVSDEKTAKKLDKIGEELKQAKDKKTVDRLVRKVIELGLEERREQIRLLKKGLKIIEKDKK